MFFSDELFLLEKLSVHDKYRIEVKLEYPSDETSKKNYYFTDIYFFFPGNLNLTAATYPSDRFYDDVRNYIRFKTPEMTLDGLLDASDPLSPLSILTDLAARRREKQNNGFQKDVEHETKLLACILRSTLRESTQFVRRMFGGENEPDRWGGLRHARQSLGRLRELLNHFREIENALLEPSVPKRLLQSYRLVDEFCSLTAEAYGVHLLEIMESRMPIERKPEESAEIEEILINAKKLAADEISYRRGHGFRSVPSLQGDNEEYVYRKGLLKRFVFTDMFLEIKQEQKISRWQQLFYGLAAGIAMAFATAVAFGAQSYLGQISWDFFAVLVVTYIFKDRIKEGFKDLFTLLLKRRLFDQTVSILDHEERAVIGRCDQKAHYMKESDVPAEVMRLRNTGRTESLAERDFAETVLFFKNAISLYPNRIHKGQDRISAINHIFRYNIRHLLLNMDEPIQKVLLFDPQSDSTYDLVCSKTYHVNVVFGVPKKEGVQEFFKIRMVLDRNGIKRVEQLNSNLSTWEADKPHPLAPSP